MPAVAVPGHLPGQGRPGVVEAQRGVVAAVDAEPDDAYVAGGSGVGVGRHGGSEGEQ
jgi:hypothetical protein